MADDKPKKVKVYDSVSGNVLELSESAAKAACGADRFSRKKPAGFDGIKKGLRLADRYPQPDGDAD